MEIALPPAAGAVTGEGSLDDDPRKWWALAVILLAQVMIMLDVAIVNIAVPAAQADLHIAPAHVQWIVTAYLLPFGALLLLGGRIADDTGRKRAFCVATVGFALASAMGGGATSEGMLFAARALQGVCAAAMAPALLSMLTLGFPREPDRGRAFSLYGGISAAAGAFGLVIGGVLTEYLSWRWSLLINVPLSALVVAGALPLLRESRARARSRYDAVGAALGTLGLLGCIDGVANVAQNGWTDAGTVAPIAAGFATLAVFAAWESRVDDPLLPLSLLRARRRAGAFVVVSVAFGPATGMTLLMLVFLQGPLHEGALSAGLHFIPFPVAAIPGALAAMRLMRVLAPRVLFAGGTVITAAGMLATTRVGTHMHFWTELAPALALFGFGASVLFVTANEAALSGIRADDSAVASAIVNTVQQVGAALGVAVLSSVAARATADYLGAHGPAAAAQAVVHGNDRAFVAGALLLLAAGLTGAWLATGAAEPAADEPAAAPAGADSARSPA